MPSQPIAKAELAVMSLLWQSENLTAREIREALYPEDGKSQNGTVQRLLQRLEDKGYVTRDRSHAVHFFSATISRQDYAGGQLESLADSLTSGSFAPLITHLVEKKKISPEEIARIRAILDESAKDKNASSSFPLARCQAVAGWALGARQCRCPVLVAIPRIPLPTPALPPHL